MSRSTTPSLRRAFEKVYKYPRYWIITILASLGYFLLAIWIPQWSLISYTFQAPGYTLFERLFILWESLGWFVVYNTIFSQIFTIIISILVGINTTFVVYYITLRARFLQTGSVGVVALLLGLLGVGCGACGPVLLSSILGLAVATGVVAVLPFKGLEFSLISLILLIISILYMTRAIQRPNTCKS